MTTPMKAGLPRSGQLLGVLLLGLASCFGAELKNPHVRSRGDELFLMGDFARAAGHYETYLSDNPGDPDRLNILLLAGKCHLGAKHPRKAVEAFDSALASNPGADLRCELNFRRGVANRIRGRAAEAVIDMKRAGSEAVNVRKRIISDDEFHYEYGLALFHNGDWKKGREQMQRVDEDDPYYGTQALSRRDLAGYTVQLGAYSDRARARREAARLNATVRSASSGNALLFFVSSGPYAKIEDAREQADHFRTRGCPDAFVLP